MQSLSKEKKISTQAKVRDGEKEAHNNVGDASNYTGRFATRPTKVEG